MTRRKRKPTVNLVEPGRPWGLLAVTLALGIFMVLVLGYAVVNTGSSDVSRVRQAFLTNPSIKDVAPFKEQTAEHTGDENASVSYPAYPPMGGPHNPIWQDCDVYYEPVRAERVVHSMEHGAVWLSYQDISIAEFERLKKVAESEDKVIMAPAERQQDAKVIATAWGLQLKVDLVDDARIKDFVETYADGPQTQEPGALCSEGSNATVLTPTQ